VRPIMSGGLIPLLLFFFLFWLAPCSYAKVKIVATIFPLYEMAKEVGGERATVHLLLPPGAEPHSFEPRPSDLRKIAAAQLILMVGAGLDNWLEDLLEAVKNRPLKTKLLRLSDGAPLIKQEHGHDHDAVDPHVWLDFKWDMKFVARLVKELSSLDIENAQYYKQNGDKYIKKLEELDLAFQKGLENCKTRTFVVGGHGAFGYLARAYGLKQLSLYGLSPDARPTPKKMVELAKTMKKLGINTIFFEGTVSSKLAEVLSKETGANISVLYTGASLTRQQIENSVTFISLMYQNLEKLKQGLGCE